MLAWALIATGTAIASLVLLAVESRENTKLLDRIDAIHDFNGGEKRKIKEKHAKEKEQLMRDIDLLQEHVNELTKHKKRLAGLLEQQQDSSSRGSDGTSQVS